MGVNRQNVHRSNNSGYRFGGGGGKCSPKCKAGQICRKDPKTGKYSCETLFTDDDQDPLGSGRGGFGYRSALRRRPMVRRRLGSSAYAPRVSASERERIQKIKSPQACAEAGYIWNPGWNACMPIPAGRSVPTGRGYRFGGGGGKCSPKCKAGQICRKDPDTGKYSCETLFTDDDQDPLGSGRGGFGYRSSVRRRPMVRRRLGSSAYRFGYGQQEAAVTHQAQGAGMNRAQVANMTGMNRARLARHTNVLHRQ